MNVARGSPPAPVLKTVWPRVICPAQKSRRAGADLPCFLAHCARQSSMVAMFEAHGHARPLPLSQASQRDIAALVIGASTSFTRVSVTGLSRTLTVHDVTSCR